MKLAKVVCVMWIWLLLVSSLTRASESDINCLTKIKSQLRDPKGYLSNWVFGNKTEGSICKFDGVECWNTRESRVMRIFLGGLGLQGEFPSGVVECTTLQLLSFSGNSLSGTLPSELASFLPFLVSLDLSDNNFSGEIPAGWSNFVFLHTLLLDHNHLTGHIPPGFASNRRLGEVSVAHNHLTGQIPDLSNPYIISHSSFEDNPGLCGFPLDPCESPLSSIVIITAACAGVVFFFVGVAIGCFCIRIGDDRKQRPRMTLRDSTCFSAFCCIFVV